VIGCTYGSKNIKIILFWRATTLRIVVGSNDSDKDTQEQFKPFPFPMIVATDPAREFCQRSRGEPDAFWAEQAGLIH